MPPPATQTATAAAPAAAGDSGVSIRREPHRIATCRLQFTPSFHFREALGVIPYLRDLGISHIYASPITRARAGSTHGYDVCDPRVPNPELGTPEELDALLRAARAAGLGWVQDIVPNHQAADACNPFFRDVLAWGAESAWSWLYDIDWELPCGEAKILLPVLPDPYHVCLERGDLRAAWDDDGPVLAAGPRRLPLCPRSLRELFRRSGVGSRAMAALHAALAAGDAGERSARTRALWQGVAADERAILGATLDALTDPGELDRLVRAQHWRLAWWRSGREMIGYRRFFAIDDLIAVRVEDPRAFALQHALVADLADRGLISGLRVDHIDGLRDPAGYLRTLRERFPRAWILVEKILGPDEDLPAGWPVEGTTGYEVAAGLTALACDPRREDAFARVHAEVVRPAAAGADLAADLRRDVAGLGLHGDLMRAVRLLQMTGAVSPLVRDLGPATLARALATLLARMPVYRTYGGFDPPTAADRAVLRTAAEAAAADRPELAAVIEALHRLLAHGLDPAAPAPVREALIRVQHLSGPVMAKGWEDTFYYAWTRWIALNEVGGDPLRFGLDAQAFLDRIVRRARAQPAPLNATATHDTKRGEDLRARLAALTWHPEAWRALIAVAPPGGDPEAPAGSDRYLMLQTLAGTWPADGGIDRAYSDRILACALKSMREAGRRTSWIEPAGAYESAALDWLDGLISGPEGSEFRTALGELVGFLAPHAGAVTLAQTAVKCALPGVPDIYQGCEWFDHALVDPDNRRPVDWAARAAGLDALCVREAWWDGPRDDLAKQALLRRCLTERRRAPALWLDGAIVPLPLAGEAGDLAGTLAFARQAEGEIALVAARFAPGPVPAGAALHVPAAWQQRRWRDALTGAVVEAGDALPLTSVLAHLPAALLLPA